MSREGVLLVNTGTPDAPEPRAVRRYLREFLSDPRVIDLPAVPRWLLLNLVILPRRPRRSAEAYRAIWTPEGSPLLVHGRAFARALGERLGENVPVALAMRYGRPGIAEALRGLVESGVERLAVLPLFPQESAAARGSAVARVLEQAARLGPAPSVRVVPPFHDHPAFLDAFAAVARPVLEEARPDRVLLSFHGLPERHVRRADPTGGHCLEREDCCDAIGHANRDCYRAQCFATARGLAMRVDLAGDEWEVTFQSRLGRTRWIEPHTDERVRDLARAGVRRLAVLGPSFVADCLETLEEIGIRAREAFRAAGGEDLVLVPSLNAHPAWVEAAVEILKPVLG